MKVRTLKRAAGAVCFDANQTIDLPDELVDSFVEAGAVEVVCVYQTTFESLESVQVQSEDGSIVEDETAPQEPEAAAAEPERQKRKRR